MARCGALHAGAAASGVAPRSRERGIWDCGLKEPARSTCCARTGPPGCVGVVQHSQRRLISAHSFSGPRLIDTSVVSMLWLRRNRAQHQQMAQPTPRRGLQSLHVPTASSSWPPSSMRLRLGASRRGIARCCCAHERARILPAVTAYPATLNKRCGRLSEPPRPMRVAACVAVAVGLRVTGKQC